MAGIACGNSFWVVTWLVKGYITRLTSRIILKKETGKVYFTELY